MLIVDFPKLLIFHFMCVRTKVKIIKQICGIGLILRDLIGKKKVKKDIIKILSYP